jgi:isoquinoline 1-oxidoreductase beta subunit
VALRVEGPVQVVWRREDDLGQGEYRDATAHRVQAVLDADGAPTVWRHRICGATDGPAVPGNVSMGGVIGATDLPYAVEHLEVAWSDVTVPVPIRIWRSVGHSYNAFVIESFIDELAARGGADPVAYRLRLLAGQPRLQRCLERVAELAGWSRAAREGRALGVAAGVWMGTHVAEVVEIDTVRVDRPTARQVWCVVDCGTVVHPDSAVAQVEGGILFGLGAALYGGVQIRDGRVLDDNFHRQRLLRIDESPVVHVEFVASDAYPSGLGEASVPGIAPALANAWFRLSGERARRLPFVPAT